ncbi:MAG: hypothetical protein L3J23_09380 [Flavobacteriaceae bacterium]|nr:hypothetical protein [Flavobacteriaceae bacterium]
MLNLLKNKALIINTDLDGILSGLFLKKYLNCKIVGFSNSAESIWLQTNFTDFKNVCFIDMYVTNPTLICIEQHIISVNEKHHEKLKKNPKKLNPNLLNPRYFLPDTSYYKKYPFGTIHFIIALLEREKYDLTNLDLYKTTSNLQLIDLILRADDTMKTTINSSYIENASEWWSWLQEFSKQGKTISKLKNYLDKTTKSTSVSIKSKIAKFLQNNPFYCDSSDGGIKELTKDNCLKENTKIYFKFISEITNIESFNLDEVYKPYNGIAKRFELTKEFQEELIERDTINNKKIFSYAFVRSSKRDYNFSCTFYQD